MKVSAIIATYNRCSILAAALESLAASRFSDKVDWEVLVVDNNSSDQTRMVVEDFCHRYPSHFRYLFEPQQGKSYALNSGIRAAQGDVLAFMDDDELVEPTWLQNLTANLHNGEWAGAGGKITPEWSRPAPRWLLPGAWYAVGPLVHFDLGDEPGSLTQNPFGGNMAFRKEMFEKYGGFRTDLGPCPGSNRPQKSEDSEFGVRLMAAGERLRYEPSALIYHPVPDHRIQKSYFVQWWFDKARADIRAYGIPQDTKYYIADIPLYLFRRLAVWTLKWVIAVNPVQRFSNKLSAWVNLGEILECYRQSSASGNGADLSGKRAENCGA